jgi:hypothetical protein
MLDSMSLYGRSNVMKIAVGSYEAKIKLSELLRQGAVRELRP